MAILTTFAISKSSIILRSLITNLSSNFESIVFSSFLTELLLRTTLYLIIDDRGNLVDYLFTNFIIGFYVFIFIDPHNLTYSFSLMFTIQTRFTQTFWRPPEPLLCLFYNFIQFLVFLCFVLLLLRFSYWFFSLITKLVVLRNVKECVVCFPSFCCCKVTLEWRQLSNLALFSSFKEGEKRVELDEREGVI